MYSRDMKPKSAAQLQEANEAAIALLTLLTVDENSGAIELVAQDDVYMKKIVSIVLGTYASCAIKMLAKMTDSDPLDIVQAIALAGARHVIDQEE